VRVAVGVLQYVALCTRVHVRPPAILCCSVCHSVLQGMLQCFVLLQGVFAVSHHVAGCVAV